MRPILQSKIFGLLLCAVALLESTTLQAAPIRIGFITDLSGGMASWGTQAALGARISVQELNQTGHEVELLIEDHQLQPKLAASAFQKLVDIDHVAAVYSEFTPTTLAIAPLSKQKRIPVIYSAAATSALQESPYIFKTYLDYIQGCSLLAANWKRRGITSVGILKPSPEFGELCELGLKLEYPEAAIAEYAPGSDVATQVLSLRARGVKAVVNATFEPDFMRMLKSMSALHWMPEVGAQSDAVAQATKKDFARDLPRISLFSLPVVPESFLAKIRAADPKNEFVSINAAALAYLHTQQLAHALEGCPLGDADCVVGKIAKEKENAEFGFKRWQNRTAVFDIRIVRP